MKWKAAIVLALFVTMSLSLVSCAQKAANSAEAIQQAQSKQSVEEKVNYLVGQANAFVNSKEFDEAIKTAQYILSNLDKDSQAAQDIIEKAKAELGKMAQQAMDDVKNKLGNLGK